MSKIIGIIGSRSRDSGPDMYAVVQAFESVYKDGDWICSGGCPKGGDRFAKLIHQQGSIPYLEFPADWKQHGRTAGIIRNTQIAKFSDVLIACVASNRTGGTEDTIKQFTTMHPDRQILIV